MSTSAATPTDPIYQAFASEHFSGVYSRFATATWARDAVQLDVPGIHADVRIGILSVVQAAHRDEDPGARILLVKGEAGMGKTHCLATELSKLARRGSVYPVMMQLAVGIPPDELSRWILKKIFDELSADKFVDAQGHPPLQRLAGLLWTHAPKALQDKFQAELDGDADEDRLDRIATDAARKIARELKRNGLSADDRPVIAGLLARAEDAGASFKAWINGSAARQSFGSLQLDPLQREDERRDVMLSLARIGRATGAPLVLAIDQIEATEQIGSLQLLQHFVAYAAQLVEEGILGTGVIICALSDVMEKISGLPQSLRQRIAMAPAPVQMRTPSPAERRRILERRAQVLLQKCGVRAPEGEAAALISPEWLFEGYPPQPRHALEAIRHYREACLLQGRFLDREAWQQLQAEHAAGAKRGPADAEADTDADADGHAGSRSPPKPAVLVDFDKAWEDRRDAAVGGVRTFSDEQRLQLLTWLVQEAAVEVPGLHAAQVSRRHIEGQYPTEVLRIEFLHAPDSCLEAWEIALANAPRGSKLGRQIRDFLEHVTNAKPGIFRADRITGFDGPAPDRPLSALKRTSAGPALVALLDAGGRVAPTESRHWTELASAREFCGEFADANGFRDWQRERQFLTHEIAIGPLAALLVPEGKPDRVAASAPRDGGPIGATPPSPAAASTTAAQTETATASDTRPAANPAAAGKASTHTAESPPHATPAESTGRQSDDPRDTARLLIGRGPDADVYWNLDRAASPTLPNFGLTVSGDAGQGKTQIIKAVLADAARLQCPTLVFDFKNDYTGRFAADHGFQVIDLRSGMPFNPFRPPPQGESGAQITPHVFEIARVLATTLGLGDQQTALLRDSLLTAFDSLDQSLHDWIPVQDIRAASLADAIALAKVDGSSTATSLINRLGLLSGMHMLPDDATATLSFDDLMRGRYVLSFNNLPNDDKLKSALAEMILIQLQGYMLRGEAPRALRRVLVFDEAWRASQSDRLIQLAREGRAFGVAVVVGTQFPDDLSPDLVGNLATKLYLYNGDAMRRRKIVQGMFGTAAGADATALSETLAGLKQFDAVFSNQQYAPYTALRVAPYFERS